MMYAALLTAYRFVDNALHISWRPLNGDQFNLYAAMDWLLERQGHIEKKLAARHLRADGLVLYDLSSSYFEGHCCPLARFGHSRDGKSGKLRVNYALVSASRGCPVAISVYEGNTADAVTLLPQVQRVREQLSYDRKLCMS